MNDRINRLVGLTLPPHMEREYIDSVYKEIAKFMHVGLIILSVGVWIFTGLIYDESQVTHHHLLYGHLALIHVIIAIGWLSTCYTDHRRDIFVKYQPVILLLFTFSHVEVAYRCWGPELGTLAHGFVVGLIFLVYGVEKTAIGVPLLCGIATSCAYIFQLHQIVDDRSFTPIYAHCIIANVAGFLICYNSVRLGQKEFYLKRMLRNEKIKTENILHSVLPESIAKELVEKESVEAKSHEDVSVLFADLVSFTSLSTKVSASRIVKYLNDLFTTIDRAADRHQIEKIKTIGDGYMAVCGCPVENENHAEHMAKFAIELLRVVDIFNMKYDTDFGIRIGIHSGPLIAGVICEKRFCYDVWGDTVNTASRIESYAENNTILVSEEFRSKLEDRNFDFIESRTIEPKGKFKMVVWQLVENHVTEENLSA